VDYLWELVDDASRPWAGELHVPLTLDAVTPRGGLVELPWMTAQEIGEFEDGLSRVEADMRMGRSRTPKRDAAYFSAWRGELVEHRPLEKLRVILAACGGRGLYSAVHVLGEWIGDGRTNSRDDAQGILDLLATHGFRLEDVDQWVGDRAHHGDRRGGKKSNTRRASAGGPISYRNRCVL
jgi:hypothetical protein